MPLMLCLAASCLALSACEAELGRGPLRRPAEQADGAIAGQQDAADVDAPDAMPEGEPDAMPAEALDAMPADAPDVMPEEAPDVMPAEPAVRPPDVCGPFDPPAVAQADVQLIAPLPEVGPDCDALVGAFRPLRRKPHPASMPLPEACGTASNYTISGAADDAPYEVHIIGVSEGAIPVPGEEDGAVEVTIERTAKPVVLVLSAHNSVHWRLHPAPDARIAGVVLSGYSEQFIEGSPVPVQWLRREYFCDHAHRWEVGRTEGPRSYAVMMHAIRAALGQTETSFQGCGYASRFTVPYAECPATGSPEADVLDEAIDPADVDLGPCAFIADESLYCATNTQEGLELFGLDTGSHCVAGPPDGHWQALSWFGEAIYGCAERGVKRFRFDTRDWEFLEVPCDGLTVDGGDLLLSLSTGDDRELPGGIFRYASAAGLLADQLLERFGPHETGRHFDADRSILYNARHSAEELERFDMARGVELPPVPLQDYHDWVLGLDVIDGRIVLVGPQGIFAFDADDGSRLFDIPMRAMGHSGLACVHPAPPAP